MNLRTQGPGIRAKQRLNKKGKYIGQGKLDMKTNAREVDKLVEEHLKMYPYISKERVGELTIDQRIAIYIDELLSILPEKEDAFINYRYINGWTIVKVAQEMNYSQQMIYVIRKKC